MKSACRLAALLVIAASLQACGTMARLDAVPPSMVGRAVTPGIPNSRYWVDTDIDPFIRSAIEDIRREREALAAAGQPTDPLPPAYFLAISGGGRNGAFAAGLLAGWSARGTRPDFKVVTGISAGGLIAPFAFLGTRYDDVVRSVATSIGKDSVFRSRGLLAGLSSDGMADSAPLARLVGRIITSDVLAAVATEYRKGRVLLIGTTDLDSGRAVTWNMGAIAASGASGALDLFRKVMVASASIPGVVSPVMIDVEVDGKRFQEMHVDGGVITQVFTYPSSSIAEIEKLSGEPFRREIHLYAIRNGKLSPDWSQTPPRTLSIGTRAFHLLVQGQGASDLERIYRIALHDGADFNLAYIGPDFVLTPSQGFDAAYMRGLFDYAYQLGAKGNPWHKAPPAEGLAER